ncbi:hypothetical protein MRX96_012374 [Rhipicephalus microplus]
MNSRAALSVERQRCAPHVSSPPESFQSSLRGEETVTVMQSAVSICICVADMPIFAVNTLQQGLDDDSHICVGLRIGLVGTFSLEK